MEELDIASLVFYAKADSSSRLSDIMKPMNFDEKPDSTGCGDIMTDNTSCTGPVFIQGERMNLNFLMRKHLFWM